MISPNGNETAFVAEKRCLLTEQTISGKRWEKENEKKDSEHKKTETQLT